MQKIIVIIIIIVLLAVGGWYFFLQQEEEEVNGEEEVINGEEEVNGEEEEVEEDTPYHQAEEVPVAPGPNEEKDEILKRVLSSVFGEAKLIDGSSDFSPADPKFEYWGDMRYMVPGEISTDEAGEIREALLDEGFDITSIDSGSESYKYTYNIEMQGESYSGDMSIVIDEGGYLNDPGIIDISFNLRN